MNINNLIEEITEKVIYAINNKKQDFNVVSQKSNNSSAKHLILLFSGYPYDDKHISNIIQNILNISDQSIFILSPEMHNKFNSMVPHGRLISLDNYSELEAKYAESRFVLVPILPFAILGKLALLISSDPLTNIISRSVIEGKKLYTFHSDYILQSNSNIQSQIDDYKSQLNKLGILTISKEEYTSLIKNNYASNNLQKETSGDCKAITGECDACGSCPTKIQEAVEKILSQGASRIGTTLGTMQPDNRMAKYIDHTLLKPDATKEDVIKLCEEAKRFSFASVCINPSFVKLSHELLQNSTVKVCTVIGFPLGATTTISKVMETRDAIANGAEEIDMVINVGAIKAKQWDVVKQDIEAVREASTGYILKVILETALLTDDEKILSCDIAKNAGVDFVKTSTGFGPGGATEHDVALMRKIVGPDIGVKASGGIRDYDTAIKMIEAGATRIGASASVAIVQKKDSISVPQKFQTKSY